MTNITNVPEGICFLSQLGEIVVNETSSDRVRVEIYPDPYLDGSAVKSRQPALYNEEFHADSEGTITLSDIAELVSPYMEGHQLREFMVKVGSEIAVFAVVNSGEIDMCASAERFLEQCFLTISNGIRRTVAGNREVLHMLVSDAVPACTVRAYYDDDSFSDVEVTVETVTELSTTDGTTWSLLRIDVSPEQFAAEGKMMYRYVVTCGVRTMEYVMDTDHVEDIGRTVVVFLNSFGVPEFLYCNGIRNAEPEYERNSAFINGRFRTYKIKETRFWEVNTGILTEEEEDWFLDMLRSKNVYLCERQDGIWQQWKEIIITECEAKTDNDPAALHSYKFKYRLAQKRQASVRVNDMPEIFTGEYNRIFN